MIAALSATDVRTALHLPAPTGVSARCMDLTGGRDADAVLLATSVWMGEAGYRYGGAGDTSPELVVAAMTDFNNALRLALVAGDVQDAALVGALQSSASLLSYECAGSVDGPNTGLMEFYSARGVDYLPLDWKGTLDADWDGIPTPTIQSQEFHTASSGHSACSYVA